MSITLRDCLKLPIFFSSYVAAGEKGLDHPVDTVTTAEIFPEDIEVFKKFAHPNELTISAFASIQDNPSMQLEIMRRSNEAKGAGLILFYVGIYLKEISKEMIQLANELQYPVIVIPSDADIAYVDMISAVMELIVKDKMKDDSFISTTNQYVNAVLNNNSPQTAFLSQSLNINDQELHGFCIMTGCDQNSLITCAQFLIQGLSDINIQTVCAAVDEHYVLLLYTKERENNIHSLYQEILDQYLSDGTYPDTLLIFSMFQKGIRSHLHNVYLNFCEFFSYFMIIFPYRTLFNYHAVSFIQNCLSIIRYENHYFDEGGTYHFFTSVLEPELFSTLCCFLLDGNMNTAATAKYLYVHTNTIIYRIRKIKERLHISLSELSDITTLSTIAAIYRIVNTPHSPMNRS
ncbi:MAG: PucR family transcriptional regulator [Lachnospiraceae bacterium]